MEPHPETAVLIGGAASGRRTSASSSRWTAVFTRGSSSAAPTSCLLTLVDDATGRTLGRFGAQETIWAAVAVLRAWIARYGIPQALYTDWKNVYVRPPTQAERVSGAEPLTQFGRMCATLGIQIIAASSPQAKGRIERNHGTQQDRLVKKLRRKGLADIETANAFLETEVLGGSQSTGSRRRPRRPMIFTSRGRAACGSIRCFASRRPRTVSNDWVVQYHNRLLQLERQSGHAPARSTVLVCENAAGTVEIRYRDRVMRWTEIIAGAAAPPRPVPVLPATIAARPAAPRGPRAAANHPWRQGFKDMGRDVPVLAAGEVTNRPWKLPEPRTPRTRPPLLGKP